MNFVPLQTFSNYIDAHIALAKLQEEGVNCHLEDENIVTLINFSSGIRLMVRDSQIERATRLIKEAEEEYVKTIPCPHCGEKTLEIKYIKQDSEDAFKGLLFAHIISQIAKIFSKEGMQFDVKRYVCTLCHKEFDALPSATDSANL